MPDSSYDLIVLGAGNAGFGAAGVAHEAGWRVLVVEGRDVGGTCPMRGCVPKKVLVAAAEVLDQISRAPTHEISVGPPELDWKKLIDRKQTFVEGVPADFEQSLANRGIDLIHGRARFVSPKAIEVGGQQIEARKILVATGSKPRPLPIEGATQLLSSDEILDLEEQPDSLVFIGAGVIALEFTHVFARAGTRVTLLELMPRPLPGLDGDAVDTLTEATRSLGVEVLTDVEVQRIEADPRGATVHFRNGGEKRSVRAAAAVNGAGRVADLVDLDLPAAGVALENGAVVVEPSLRSRENPDVYFAGDALPGTPQLSPIATYEGRIAGKNMVTGSKDAPDYTPIPGVVSTVPALATVGFTEEEARNEGRRFAVKSNDMVSWRSARTHAETAAFAKVLVEEDTGRILGAHLVGHGAQETIHTFALAIKHDLTAEDLGAMVYAYPTFNSDLRFLI